MSAPAPTVSWSPSPQTDPTPGLDALTWLNNVEFFAYLVLRDADEDDEEDEDDERTEEEQNNYILRSMMCLLTVQFYQRLAHGWKHELNEDGTRSWRLYI